MTAKAASALIGLAQMFASGQSQAEPSKVIGSWKVEITFSNGESRSVHFDARAPGKGSLVVVSPNPAMAGQTGPSLAEWTQGDVNSVTFSGAVEFPLGNVGRDPGTLVFKGKLESETLISGEVDFSPLIGEEPSKHGTFKAVRAGSG
ncbi:MAG: hypothetical protein ACR2II_09910 [Chthoniobacterales bacterium]